MKTTTKPTRPALRWHGGKWVLAPWIISHFPPHNVYTEAFGGAGSVLMRKRRSSGEVWNDLDGDVVNFFEVLRDRKSAGELRRILYLTPFSRSEFEKAYESSSNPVERAQKLVVKSFMGFGSNAHNRAAMTGFRANSNRSYTTPAKDWSNYPLCLGRIIKRLRGVIIENRDALGVLEQHDTPETLHYVDPPYLHETRGTGHGARTRYFVEMPDEGHEKLAQVLHGLRGMIVLSGYPNDMYDRLYAGWETSKRKAMADGARERTEVLWLNPKCSEGLKSNTSLFGEFD